ncbi:S-adenosyl-L-methionine-dependent methyltransferase [Naematelia encephala]|uniref:S-adenosyl-L-methionine-dependent methyltransferase n=1 Tax=Naematelia encephala TaxID=71784 RepID=A0A1Y2BL72_9TREE|nr:S-adenosyl-L-methionine-dependent methyltransferase [Naematelia encephala]
MSFYKAAAHALDHLDKHQGSVKGSVAAAGVKAASTGETKRILALVIETLKYKPVLLRLLEIVPVHSLERLVFPRKSWPSSASLLLVLLHDLLFSAKGRIEASDKWPPKEAVLRHQARLRAELVRIQIKEGVARKHDLGKKGDASVVRYVRWNPNVDYHRAGDWSFNALLQHLDGLGFSKVEPGFPIPDKSYFVDPHIDCLLCFSATTNWWNSDIWYTSGAIILQDKASCFPARILMEGWKEGDCLDATAAPGNKTSFISALMANRSKVYAFERSGVRYKTLETMLARAECRNVLPRRADFTNASPESDEFARVTHILLDPSCSGSGIVNRLDYLVDQAVEESETIGERLEKLAAFQLQMIVHAFQFPAAERIVYSTCSIHAEEDEQVVMAALSSPSARERGWKLAPRAEVLPAWERRGRPDEMDGVEGQSGLAESVIRCLPEDHTNGFFVACFVRGLADAKKRNRDEPEETDPDAVKAKTLAQMERARRKKQAQKKRRRLDE